MEYSDQTSHVYKCVLFFCIFVLSVKRPRVPWWCKCSYTGLHSAGETENRVTLVWKWSHVMILNTGPNIPWSFTLKNPGIHPQKPISVNPCRVCSTQVESFSTFAPCRLNYVSFYWPERSSWTSSWPPSPLAAAGGKFHPAVASRPPPSSSSPPPASDGEPGSLVPGGECFH